MSLPAPLRPVHLNGRFLTQPVGGVQRFAREVVRALDLLLEEDRTPEARAGWTLLVPEGTRCDLELRNIQVRAVGGRLKGHAWEQWACSRAARGGLLVNLGNSGSLLHPRSLVVIHDAAVYRTPQNFSRNYRTFHQLLGRAIARRSSIATVSAFSRGELAQVLGVDASTIGIVPNSAEHIRSVTPDAGVLGRLGVQANRYFLVLASPSPNKNLPRAMEAFARFRDSGHRLVVVGATNLSVFQAGFAALPEGIIAAGRLSDSEVAALMQAATALVFPSLYEGFGIPPLEAMINACPVIASRIPPVEEVCGDAALYFDPLDPSSIAEAMQRAIDEPATLAAQVEKGRSRADLFSWRRSAIELLALIRREGAR